MTGESFSHLLVDDKNENQQKFTWQLFSLYPWKLESGLDFFSYLSWVPIHIHISSFFTSNACNAPLKHHLKRFWDNLQQAWNLHQREGFMISSLTHITFMIYSKHKITSYFLVTLCIRKVLLCRSVHVWFWIRIYYWSSISAAHPHQTN